MKKLYLVIVINFFLWNNSTFAQHQTPVNNKNTSSLQEHSSYKLGSEKKMEGFRLKPNSGLKAKDVFKQPEFRFTENDQVKESKVFNDQFGYTHRSYQQFYKGVEVTGGSYILQENTKGELISGIGQFQTDLNINVNPSVTESAAEQIAKSEVGGGFVVKEKASLRIISDDNSYTTESMKLAYCMVLKRGFHDLYTVEVDAHQGNVIRKDDNKLNCVASNLSADNGNRNLPLSPNGILKKETNNQNIASQYNPQNITVDAIPYYTYQAPFHPGVVEQVDVLKYSLDPGNTVIINQLETLGQAGRPALVTQAVFPDAFPGGGIMDFMDSDGDHLFSDVLPNEVITSLSQTNIAPMDFSALGVGTHFNLQKALEYYYTKYNWIGFDGNGVAPVTAYVWFDKPIPQLGYYSDKTINFSALHGSGPTVTIATVGHELTHGIIDLGVNVKYQLLSDQGKSIVEGLCEVGGLNIKNYWRAQHMLQPNFLEDEELVNPIDFTNPKIKQYPTTYLGEFYNTVDNHGKSLPFIYWYTLLVDGGSNSHIDDDPLNRPFNVQGIGVTDAEKIVWRTMTTKINNQVNYQLLAEMTLEATQDLINLNQLPDATFETVRQAWQAVGIYVEPRELSSNYLDEQLQSFYDGLVVTEVLHHVVNNNPVKTVFELTAQNHNLTTYFSYNPDVSAKYFIDQDFANYFVNEFAFRQQFPSEEEAKVAVSAQWGMAQAFKDWSFFYGWNCGGNSDIKTFLSYDPLITVAENIKILKSTNEIFITLKVPGTAHPRVSLDLMARAAARAGFGKLFDPNGLGFTGETVALEHSFSDIMAYGVKYREKEKQQLSTPWTIGETTYLNDFDRSFKNPKAKGQPNFYKGENFQYVTQQLNSGILNYMFYLLAGGGSGFRDFNPANPIDPGKGSFVVVPISQKKAESIIINTILNNNFVPSGLTDFATAALKTTENLYGINNQEYVSVTNALYAVGLLDQPYGGFPGSLPKDQAGILDPKDAVEPWDLKAWQTQSYVAETKNPVYQFAFAYDPAEINKCNTILGSLNCGNAEVFTSPETAMSINGLSIMVNATLHANKIVYWKLFITEYDGLDCRSSLDVCDNIILPINSTTPIQSFKTDTRKPEVLAGQQVYPWFGDQSIEVAAVRGAQQYQVLATVDTNPEFKFPLLINEIINSTSADPEKLKTQGCLHVETKYLAKAMAVGPYEDVTHELTNGVWSEPAEFITTSPSVKIIEPSYGAKVAPFGVPIKLEWEEAPGAAFYKLMISDNANDPNQNNVTWEHIGDIYDTEYFLNDGNGYQLKNIADGKQYGFTVTPYSPICMPEVTTHEKGLTTKGSFVLEKQLIPLVTPLSPSGCQNYEDKLVFTWQPIVGGNEITYKISVVNDLKTIGSATIKGAANSSVEIPGLPSTPDNTVTGDILWTIHAESNGVQGPSTGLVYKFKSAQITGLNLYKNGNVSQPDPNQIDAWQDLGAEWNSKWSPFGYHVTVWRTDANTITWEDDFSTEFCTIPSGALRVDVLHKLTVISKNPYCGITAEQDLFFKTKAKKEEAEPKPDPKPTDDPENCDVTFYVEWWDFIYQDGNPNTSVPGENYDGKVEAGLEYTTDGINFFPMTDANQLPNQVPFLLSGVSGAATQVTFFPASIGTVKIYVKVYKREGQFSVLNEPTVEITPTPGAPSSIGLFGILPGQHHVVAELNCPSTTDGRVANQTIAGQSLKAISNVAEDELTIAPNPVESTITISGAIDEFSEMTIQNVTGQIVYHGKPIAKLDVKHLSPGVYILKIGTRVIRFVKK